MGQLMRLTTWNSKSLSKLVKKVQDESLLIVNLAILDRLGCLGSGVPDLRAPASQPLINVFFGQDMPTPKS